MANKFYNWQCKCCQSVFYGYQRKTITTNYYGVSIPTKVCPKCESPNITCYSLNWITDTLGDEPLRTTLKEDEDEDNREWLIGNI